jgi:hypothetical protein
MVKSVSGADRLRNLPLITHISHLIQMALILIFTLAAVLFCVIVAIMLSIILLYSVQSVGIITCALVLICVMVVTYWLIQRY